MLCLSPVHEFANLLVCGIIASVFSSLFRMAGGFLCQSVSVSMHGSSCCWSWIFIPRSAFPFLPLLLNVFTIPSLNNFFVYCERPWCMYTSESFGINPTSIGAENATYTSTERYTGIKIQMYKIQLVYRLPYCDLWCCCLWHHMGAWGGTETGSPSCTALIPCPLPDQVL